MEKKISIDDRMDSYKTFFDHEWSKKINRLVDKSKIEQVVFDLATAWKSAANTHAMPWLMAHQLKPFYAGLMKTNGPYAADVVNALLTRLARESNNSIPVDVIDRLRKILRHIALDVGVKREQIVGEFDAETAWKEFLTQSEFRLSIWGSQRLVYAAVYYSYEDFLVRCFKLASNQKEYRIRGKDFSKDFAAAFGIPLRDDCWSFADVHVARVTRHALVHNGGRVTSDLLPLKHDLSIINGEIQIMAPDTRALFEVLKVRAFRLSEEMLRRHPNGEVA